MIFLDTSGLLCLQHRSELQHAEAVRHFTAAPKVLTHNLVLAEFVPLAHKRGLSRRRTINCLTTIYSNPLLDVVFVDKALHDEAIQLLQQRLDKTWSLCDAVSFVLMDDLMISEALTTDHHFEQAGFVRLLKP